MSFAGRRRLRVAGSATQPPGTDWGAPGIGGGEAPIEPYFSDSFEGPAFNNANGFTWDTNLYSGTRDPQASNPKTGSASLEFRYPAQPTLTDYGPDYSRYFQPGISNLSEFWMQYDWLVPSNFAHRNTPPVSNNKLWTLFAAGNPGAQNGAIWVGGEFTHRGANESNYRPMATRGTDTNVLTHGGTFLLASGDRFISASGPVVPGTYAQLRFHVKRSSTASAADGAYEVWIDGVKFFESFNNIYWQSSGNSGVGSFTEGYLMGAANSGYTSATTFALDDFTFYNTNPGW